MKQKNYQPKELYMLISSIVPEGAVVKLIKSDFFRKAEKNVHIDYIAGIEITLWGDQFPRHVAWELYEKIRSLMPDLCKSIFKEDLLYHWNHELYYEVVEPIAVAVDGKGKTKLIKLEHPGNE